jgi:plastocyanin
MRWVLLGTGVGAMLGLGGCAGSGADAAHVLMSNELRFEPTTVEIPVDGTVSWRNEGSRTHTATSVGEDRDPDGEFDSGEVIGTGTFTHRFASAGTYTYLCQVHGPEMIGLVVVVE